MTVTLSQFRIACWYSTFEESLGSQVSGTNFILVGGKQLSSQMYLAGKWLCAAAEIIVGSILFSIMIVPLDDKTANGHNDEVSNSCDCTM